MKVFILYVFFVFSFSELFANSDFSQKQNSISVPSSVELSGIKTFRIHKSKVYYYDQNNNKWRKTKNSNGTTQIFRFSNYLMSINNKYGLRLYTEENNSWYQFESYISSYLIDTENRRLLTSDSYGNLFELPFPQNDILTFRKSFTRKAHIIDLFIMNYGIKEMVLVPYNKNGEKLEFKSVEIDLFSIRFLIKLRKCEKVLVRRKVAGAEGLEPPTY